MSRRRREDSVHSNREEIIHGHYGVGHSRPKDVQTTSDEQSLIGQEAKELRRERHDIVRVSDIGSKNSLYK